MGDRENTGRENQEPQRNPPAPLPPAVAQPALNPQQPHSNDVHGGPNQDPQEPRQWFRNPDWWMVVLTALTFTFGIVTLIVFYRQFREMHTQTGILNRQAQQAAADSIESATKVEKQLGIADKQAKAAQDSVAAIQRQTRTAERAWVTVVQPAIGALQENQPITGTVKFVNVGNPVTCTPLSEQS